MANITGVDLSGLFEGFGEGYRRASSGMTKPEEEGGMGFLGSLFATDKEADEWEYKQLQKKLQPDLDAYYKMLTDGDITGSFHKELDILRKAQPLAKHQGHVERLGNDIFTPWKDAAIQAGIRAKYGELADKLTSQEAFNRAAAEMGQYDPQLPLKFMELGIRQGSAEAKAARDAAIENRQNQKLLMEEELQPFKLRKERALIGKYGAEASGAYGREQRASELHGEKLAQEKIATWTAQRKQLIEAGVPVSVQTDAAIREALGKGMTYQIDPTDGSVYVIDPLAKGQGVERHEVAGPTPAGTFRGIEQQNKAIIQERETTARTAVPLDVEVQDRLATKQKNIASLGEKSYHLLGVVDEVNDLLEQLVAASKGRFHDSPLEETTVTVTDPKTKEAKQYTFQDLENLVAAAARTLRPYGFDFQQNKDTGFYEARPLGPMAPPGTPGANPVPVRGPTGKLVGEAVKIYKPKIHTDPKTGKRTIQGLQLQQGASQLQQGTPEEWGTDLKTNNGASEEWGQ
jgi:hypothetical protein